MESLEWLFGLGPAGGFAALFYLTVKFFGASQKDATDAAIALYERVNQRCEKCEGDLVTAKERIVELEIELSRMRKSAPSGEIRQEAQLHRATKHALGKDKK